MALFKLVNRPGFREGRLCESGRDGLIDKLLVIHRLSFGRRYTAERFGQAGGVKPGHPFELGQFDGLTGFQGMVVGRLSFMEPIDSFGQGIALNVALATHRRLNASFCQPLTVYQHV